MGTPLFLLLLLTPAALGLMVARCPEGWRARGGSNQCYKVHSYGRDRTFNDARIYCQARGGDLAFIDTKELRDWLGQLAGATGNVGQDAYMWVGAENVDGTWKWIETDEPVDNIVIQWEGTGSGDCAALTANSKLIKQDCSQQLKFICHRNIEIPMACDHMTDWEDAGDRCYKKSRGVNSWHDAEVECGVEGGHLISIGGDADQQLAHDLAVQEYDKVWIGYTEEGHPGEFSWSDGSNSNKTYWHDGQPDTSFNGFGAAVVNYDDPSGLWMVEKVTNEYHYLCEKPQGSCLPGWEEFERSCYYFNTESTDAKVWEDAKKTCEDVKAKMVVLDTQGEDEFFRTHMPESDTVWIGLYSKPGDNIYWTDGTSMSSKNYTHMSDEDKNSAIANANQTCAYLTEILDSDGVTKISSWIPTDCKAPRHYACEADVGAQLTLIPPANDRYCPDGGWQQLGDHCYLFSADEKTWVSAQKYCKGQHRTADLVSILTWAEQDFVLNQQLAGGWIGLNQMKQGEKWAWSDGSEVTIVNWETGEPNGDEESCVEMYYFNGKWNDLFCSDKKTFSCKMPASTTPIGTITTTTAFPDYSACGFDWTENPTTGECYRIEVQELIFNDARLHCLELHHEGEQRADLVSIYSPEEQTFVFNLLVAQHLGQTGVWIGMKNDMNANMWMDGTPTAYYNFNDGEPNGYWSEECIEMYTNTGKWNDAFCSERRPFICEKKGRNYVGPQPPPPPNVMCPSGWSLWGNNCYYFSSDTADWFTAESKCQDMMESHLASITNPEENDFVQGVLKGMSRDAWLGLRDDDHGDNWHWTDGSLYFWTNWGDGEPNNYNDEEHCGEMRSFDYYYDGKWNDIACSVSSYYVCKMGVRTCPQNWAYKDGKCYYVSDYVTSQGEGEIRCQEENTKATLVNIHSEEENQFFMEQLIQSSSSCWMGLRYDGTNWTWSDGTPMEYENWNGGEPNNLEVEKCGEMIDYPNGLSNGKWNNLNCGENRAFGCELYPTHAIGCEAGWQAFGDYCYWFSNADYNGEYVSHDEAQRQCKDKGANLASIHSFEENQFVFSLLENEYTCTMIGFTDIGHHLRFEWDDGTEVVYTDVTDIVFSDLQWPEVCGCYMYYYSGQWAFQDCSSIGPFVCKKPAEAIALHPETNGCDEGDLYYETSCYALQSSASWEAAKSDCKNQGRQLMVLENRFETAYISSSLAEMGLSTWIGLSGTIASDGSVTFSWVNDAPLDYTYWDKYEPNPEHGTCVKATGDRSGFWGVRDCNDKYDYFCEYDRVGYTAPPPPTTKAPSDYCIYGWHHKGQRCYKVVQEAAIWGDAEQKCTMFGGHLVSVKDEVEQNLILALPDMDQIVDKYGNVWVGLVLNTESGYEWTDGTGVDFVNWAEGQPESHGGKESCVSADATTLKLSDSVCRTHLPFVCEAPTGSMMTTDMVPTKPPLHPCDDDSTWYRYNSHCYKFISSTDEPGQTWWHAHRRCREEGGELASIMSDKENYWIESMIYDKAGQAMWIGGRAMLGTGYEWLDGQPFIYDNWASGEPNDVHEQEDCISMYTNNQGYWNDQNCGLPAGRICKRQAGATLPPAKTTKAPDGHCPEGWLHTGTKCVYFIMDRMNFTTARKVCQKLGNKMDLASVHSAAEQAYLTAAMATLSQHMWIGMRYELGFYWVDQSGVTYTNWGAGEPNGGAGKEECVEVSSETGKWNDISCSDEFGAVCMMLQDPTLPDHHTPNKCPSPHSNYMAYNGACYRVVTTAQSWKEAETTCKGEDAHLVSIMSVSDDSFVWAAGLQHGLSSLWMGLNNKGNFGLYEWSDGWPTIYTNWAEHEPAIDPIRYSCVLMNVTDGRWYAKSCNRSEAFICRYTEETAPTPDPPSTGRCPDNRWKDLKGGYCYLFSNHTLDWSAASQICMQENAHLVSVHSMQEMLLITLHMQGYNEPFWIGLLETNTGEVWTDHTSLNFHNWMVGEPNSHIEKCTEAVARTGLWNDVECAVSRYYICKTPKIQEGTQPPIVTSTKPDGGDGGSDGGLSGGGIAGIIIAVLFVVAAMGFVGYSYIQKQPKGRKNTDQQHLSFENTTYSAGKTERTEPEMDSVAVINVLDGSDA